MVIIVFNSYRNIPEGDDTTQHDVPVQSDDDFIGLWKNVCETQQKTVSWMLGMQIRIVSVSNLHTSSTPQYV